MKRLFLFVAAISIIICTALPNLATAQQPNYREVGQIIIWPAPDGVLGYTIPYGYFRCDGRVLSTTTYPELFAKIGYVYGGSGLNFNLPNLEHRFVLGADNQGDGSSSLDCGVTNNCLSIVGYYGGEISHTLTITEIASHDHDRDPNGREEIYIYGSGTLGYTTGSIRSNASSTKTGASGGGKAHNNVPPYMALNYIIAYTTAFTSTAPTPFPTHTPVPTDTPVPTHTPVPTDTPVPTHTPVSTDTPVPTNTPVSTDTPVPTDTPGPTPECSFSAFPDAPLIDDFNRADEGPPPSADWNNVSGLAGLYVSSNQLAAQDGYSAAIYTTTLFGPNVDAYMSVSQPAYLIVRGSDGVDTGYSVGYASGAINLSDMSDPGNGISQYIGNYADAQIGIRAITNTITAYFRHDGGDWVEQLSFEDDTSPNAGNVVVLMGNPAVADDLHAGNITCAPIVVPTPDAYTQTLRSGETLYIPIVVRFGEIIIAASALLIGGALGLSFLFRPFASS